MNTFTPAVNTGTPYDDLERPHDSADLPFEDTYSALIQRFPFEVWSYDADRALFAETFPQALRIMRRCYDAKITRLSDSVVLAQNQTGDN